MKVLIKIGFLLLSFVFISACASKPCRTPVSPEERKLQSETSSEGPRGDSLDQAARVKVAKSNGSKQCDATKGITADKMEAQLKPLKVFSRSTESDGKMRIQMCGADAGYFNVYEINKSDLEKAKGLGFKEWKK